jgi:GNAT superfamily N-acetyltransferase
MRLRRFAGRGVVMAASIAPSQSGPMTPPIEIVLDEHPRREDRKRLEQEIDLFNARSVPGEDERFALFLRDGGGTLVGGLDGVIGWAWLFVDSLWVHEELRGHGFGRELLARAERLAAERGCHSAWLDTFQALGFYERLGYTVFAALEDYPPGQTKYFLRKRLAGVR